MALLDYIEGSTDGFRILVRDSPPGQQTGNFASLMSDVASQVEHLLAAQFTNRALDPKQAPMYAQMLVGMVALTGQWWLENPKAKKRDVAAALVNLAWNGLTGLEAKPEITTAEPARTTRVDASDDEVDLGRWSPAGTRRGCPRGRRCGSARTPGMALSQRTSPPAPAMAAASSSTSSVARHGCALRAGAKPSSTPQWSSCSPAPNHTPPRAARAGGLGISGMPQTTP